MLWYKSWLETRWALVFLFGLYGFVWIVDYATPKTQPNKLQNLELPLDVFAFAWIAASVTFAGSGIKTPSVGFRNTKGLHGSTHYTLSLPVSRRRFVRVRATVGLLETAFLIVVLSLVGWRMFPDITAQSTVKDMLAYLGVAVICSSTFHFASMFLATFLDDFLRIPAAMTILALLIALDTAKVLPPYLNIFRPMGSASPLMTHEIPWITLAVALAASAVFFLATMKIVQTQEY
jgi:hypothetical protein